MAEKELTNSALFMGGDTDDAFIAPALKFDFIYQYMPDVDWKYLSEIPSYKQPAYNLKRVWLLASNGYVPEWHQNFIPTKLGNSIIAAINRKIFSGALLYEVEDKDKEETKIEDIRRWLVNTYMDEIDDDYEGQLRLLSEYSQSSGDAAFVAKVRPNGNIYFKTYREDKYLPTWCGGELVSVRLFSSFYNSLDTAGKSNGNTYVLEDYRYYKDSVPYSMLRVFQQNSSLNSIVDGHAIGLTYDQIEKGVADQIHAKIGDRLNKPTPLLFGKGKSLGVRILPNSKGSKFFDMEGYHDSTLAPVLEQLFEYDRSYTTYVNDIALGRGQVLLPDTMDFQLSESLGLDRSQKMLAAIISDQNTLNSKIMKKYKTANPEDQKPLNIQFEMRVEEHLASLKGQRINILNGIGINPGSIDPTIDESGHAKTATEVIQDVENLVTYVEEKRKEIAKVSDWAISIIIDWYFDICKKVIKTHFTAGGLNNAMLQSEMVVNQYTAGLRSLESAVAMINANDGKREVDKELKSIEENGKKKQTAINNQFDPFGGGNDLPV